MTAAIIGVSAFGAWNYFKNISTTKKEEWVSMPDGKMYHISCIHHHEDEFKVQRLEMGSILSKKNKNGHLYQEWLPPCEYKPKMKEHVKNLGHYSDWSVYA